MRNQDIRKAVAAVALSLGCVALAQQFPALNPGPRASLVGFLLSSGGRRVLRLMKTPMAKALLQRIGEPVSPDNAARQQATIRPASRLETAAAPEQAPSGCGTQAGTRFNLEPRTPPDALPQDGPAVDFLPGAGIGGADLVLGGANEFRGGFSPGFGNSLTGYYVHRNGADANPCAPDFEGGLPDIRDRSTGELLSGGGDSAVEADPARAAFFFADLRLGLSSAGIVLFRATAAGLNDTTACPDGTHTPDAAKTCWPVKRELNSFADGSIEVKPHIAVDQRAIGSGTGAGDVYVSATLSTFGGNFIILGVCRNDLSACSNSLVVSGADANTEVSHVRIRPNIATNPLGAITLTYANIVGNTFDLKYVTCTPSGAPAAPVCVAPRFIHNEGRPIFSAGGLGGGGLATSQFLLMTYPKHDHRQDANGIETYMVWDRCHAVPINTFGALVCPDTDIRMAASNDNGLTWRIADVDASPGDQYMPWVQTDPGNTINIAYYSTQLDPMHHRPLVLLRQIAPGSATPDPAGNPHGLFTVAWEPAADFFLGRMYIGVNIGMSARRTATGNRAYVHYTHNIVNGVYNGVAAPEQNNHVTRFDY